MFIRKTTTRSTAGGKSYATYRLVRNERDGPRVRQKTLLNLGRHFDLAEPDWSILCWRIDAILNGQGALDFGAEPSPDIERLARSISARLLSREGAEDPQVGADFQEVDITTLELARPRSVGVEHVGLAALNQLGLPDLFARLGIPPSLCAAAIGSIIGRIARPGSERATRRWLAERSALGELLGVDFQAMSLKRLYRASDALMAHRDTIEQHMFSRVMTLLDLKPAVTLYDLTDTCFEGQAWTTAQRGHSREKLCPLVTLGLVLDGSGFVRRSRAFAGNVREAGTLAEMLNILDAPQDTLMVMDRGMASEESLHWLREQEFQYLVVSRERNREFDFMDTHGIGTVSGPDIRLQRIPGPETGEVRLHCFSEEQAAKEEEMVARLTKRFESQLKTLDESLSKPSKRNNINHIEVRIDRIKARNSVVAPHYEITVETDDTGARATRVRFARRPDTGSIVTLRGACALRSNLPDQDDETLWRTCVMLSEIEATFRSLSGEPGLPPFFHHKPGRADGHLFISVIAYQVVQLIRCRLRRVGETARWSELRDILEAHQRVTATFSRSDGATIHVRKPNRAEPEQAEIYKALGIDSRPGGTQKTVISAS